jgi:hypothetical protein
MTGPGLTVLAIIGIICMVAVLIAIAVLLVQEALRVRRLFRGARVMFRVDVVDAEASPPADEIEPPPRPERRPAMPEVPPGWGFGGEP